MRRISTGTGTRRFPPPALGPWRKKKKNTGVNFSAIQPLILFSLYAPCPPPGEDLGGASSGQPKTTHANWAQATKGYSDFQRCNPIRKDATFGALKYAE